jgi:hypothetical protein
VVSFTARPLYPRERAPGTHWIRGWVGPSAGLDDVEKGNVYKRKAVQIKIYVKKAKKYFLHS